MYKEIKRITICAILVALGIIFGRFLSIPLSLFGVYSINIGFGALPILLLCVLYGPVYGCISAIAWDLIGALLFPNGAFVIWFTLAAGVFGLVVGLFFSKSNVAHVFDDINGYGSVITIFHSAKPATLKRVFMAVACGQLLYSVLLNTLLIMVLYSVPFKVLFFPRLFENIIMIFANTALVMILLRVVRRASLVPERFFNDANSLDNASHEPKYQSAQPELHQDEQKVIQAKPVIDMSKKNYGELLGQVGGYICNGDYEKAMEIYESLILAFRADSTIFTPNQRKDFAQYKMMILQHAPKDACIVVTPAFDVDAEFELIDKYLYEGNTGVANAQIEKVYSYFRNNMSMFNKSQKERLRQYMASKSEN